MGDEVILEAKPSVLGNQYVRAERLLEILFDPDCRPCLRWLRKEQATGSIPVVRIGRLVYFDPVAVKAHLDARAIPAPRRRSRGSMA